MMMDSLTLKNARPQNSAPTRKNIASSMIANGTPSVKVDAAHLVLAERICSGVKGNPMRGKSAPLISNANLVAAHKENVAMQ